MRAEGGAGAAKGRGIAEAQSHCCWLGLGLACWIQRTQNNAQFTCGTRRYQGTADAVRHYLEYLAGPRHAAAEDVLILAGDQL